jgi:hypothetical protein
MIWAEFSERHRNKTISWQGQLGSLKKFQVDPKMLSHQNMPFARLIQQAAGLLRTRFIPHDTRWQAARRGLQPVGLDRFLYLYLLYGVVEVCSNSSRAELFPSFLEITRAPQFLVFSLSSRTVHVICLHSNCRISYDFFQIFSPRTEIFVDPACTHPSTFWEICLLSKILEFSSFLRTSSRVFLQASSRWDRPG